MSPRLPSTIHSGILRFPTTFAAKSTAENLLEQDRDRHHCFYAKQFHNHLSHHLLAAFDLGAPSKVLQAIYESESKILKPISQAGPMDEPVEISPLNWKEFLGIEKHYQSYLSFFTSEIAHNGVEKTLEKFLFDQDGSQMLFRFVGGAFHPFIQTGYAAEFGSDAMMAQALAQTAAHQSFLPDLLAPTQVADNTHTEKAVSLFEILRQVYDSEILKPVMPYDPNANIRLRFRDASKDGRLEEIRRIASSWLPSGFLQPELVNKKIEEMFWVTTLLLGATSKRGRKPRLDFFLMHSLNASIFFPSVLKVITNPASQIKLFKAYLPVLIMYIIIRGRPRVDPELLMGFTASPHPPLPQHSNPIHNPTALSDRADPDTLNPWMVIIDAALSTPDAHVVKAIRALFYAAKHYGGTKVGDVLGPGKTNNGIENVDGSVFVRTAGLVLDTLGWVNHGQALGRWDYSALGWDDAWNDEVE